MSISSERGVVVTGASRGIGRVIADFFHAQGDRVIICSRSTPEEPLPEAMEHERVDVRQRQQVQEFLKRSSEKLGNLQVVVNCAGISQWRPIQEVDELFVQKVFETSLMGTLWSCSAAADLLGEGGAIINLSSLAGKRGSANNSVYCAAKFAVNGLTQALAKELGPKIRVNAVCPVYVRTEQILESLQGPAAPPQGRPVEEYLEEFAQTQTALQRLPEAYEVAQTVHFLASQAASAVTGQCLNVDCGTLPQ